jgi:hypothetical protein
MHIQGRLPAEMALEKLLSIVLPPLSNTARSDQNVNAKTRARVLPDLITSTTQYQAKDLTEMKNAV